VLQTLFEFAYMPPVLLDHLADLAEAENWNYPQAPADRPYPILFNYLQHTFMRLSEEGKIAESEQGACFNTGLVTDLQEPIYAYLVPNPNVGQQRWKLEGFVKESDRRLLAFSTLPEMAHYFEEPGDLIYDARLPLRPNLDHIMSDNRERFPEQFRAMETYQLRVILDGAIQHAMRRVARNYKTAIPNYYRPTVAGRPGRGTLQLLLPLCLTHPKQADLALAVYREKDVYLGATILTLDMAYNNARLIARPDSEWLKAD
jgi:hypothetical protein